MVTHINPLPLAHLPPTPWLCWQGTLAQPPHSASGRGALPGISHRKQLAPGGGSRRLTVSRCAKAPAPRRPEVSSCAWELGRLASDQDFSNAKAARQTLACKLQKIHGCRETETSILHLQGPLGKPLQPQQLLWPGLSPESLTKLIVTMILCYLPTLLECGGSEDTILGVQS